MNLIYYITWGEPWSPVLQGQAGDVVSLLNEVSSEVSVKLLCGISLRQFFANRKRIKTAAPSASVVPVYPGNRNWEKNVSWLSWFLRIKRPQAVIARGPVASALVIRARRVARLSFKICYDGRGARAAEIEEYSPLDPLANEMASIEDEAVNCSDWRIAVSQALVDHWNSRFSYSGNAHTIIPCSLARQFDRGADVESQKVRASFHWTDENVIIAHAGGGAGWQHGSMTFKVIKYWLEYNKNICLLVLSKPTGEFDMISEMFPGRVVVMQAPHEEMPNLLSACDYGLLVREETVTNRVASPVKFAEYLVCGLKVLISPDLGDFSLMVTENKLGYIIEGEGAASCQLQRIVWREKTRLRKYGLLQFSKEMPFIRDRYTSVMSNLIN